MSAETLIPTLANLRYGYAELQTSDDHELGDRGVMAVTEVTPTNQIEVLGTQIRIPAKDAFGTEPFMDAPDLDALGYSLIAKHPERLKAAGQAQIRYQWKATGGSQYGKPLYGNCQKASGLVQHFSGCDFVVWFAADHLFETVFMQRQLEALMFRCLCHIGVNENTESFVFLGPDFHGYADEVRLYGLWDQPLRALARVLPQMPLFDEYREPPASNVSPFPTEEDGVTTTWTVRRRGRRTVPTEDTGASDPPEEGAEAGELVGAGAE